MTPWHYPALPAMIQPPRSPLAGPGDTDAGLCFFSTSTPETPWSHLFHPGDTDAVLEQFYARERPELQLVEVMEKRAVLAPGPDCPPLQRDAVTWWLAGFWAAEANQQRAALRDPDLEELEWMLGFGFIPLGDEDGGARLGELFFAPGMEQATDMARRYHERVGGHVLVCRLRRVDRRFRG